MKTQVELAAEEATGIVQRGSGYGTVYASEHETLTPEQALDRLLDGKTVEIPNAGAGTYRQFFTGIGFKEVKVIDWTSSAGDWCFGVFDGECWRHAFQSNRYPRFGFTYSLGDFVTDTFEELCQS
jgi:hypothetical protein